MRAAQWNDYELIDTGDGERLERWGDILLIRPDPQILWSSDRADPRWRSAHARYHRSKSGGGSWEAYKPMPQVWKIAWNDLTFRLKPMGFKHTGIFPEQAVNWAFAQEAIRKAGRPIKVLNLFGYTGAATLPACGPGPPSPTWTPAKAWSSGQRRTPRPAAWRTGRCAGWWTTA